MREHTTLTRSSYVCPLLFKVLRQKFTFTSQIFSKLQIYFTKWWLCNLKLFSFVRWLVYVNVNVNATVCVCLSHMFTLSFYVNWNGNWHMHARRVKERQTEKDRNWEDCLLFFQSNIKAFLLTFHSGNDRKSERPHLIP